MNTYLIIGALGAILLAGAAFIYFDLKGQNEDLQNSLRLSEANNVLLTEANQENINTINILEDSYRENEERFNNLQRQFQAIRRQNNELRAQLSESNLNRLGLENPVTLETFVNSVSKDSNRCLELLTGATLTAAELAAVTPEEFNSQCPDLFLRFRPQVETKNE